MSLSEEQVVRLVRSLSSKLFYFFVCLRIIIPLHHKIEIVEKNVRDQQFSVCQNVSSSGEISGISGERNFIKRTISIESQRSRFVVVSSFCRFNSVVSRRFITFADVRNRFDSSKTQNNEKRNENDSIFRSDRCVLFDKKFEYRRLLSRQWKL